MYNRDDLLVKIAILYYDAEMTQKQIAEELNMSRATVNSLLKEARERGIVSITIRQSTMSTVEQAKFIENKYNIQTVLITEANGSIAERKREVGRLAAEFIEEKLGSINSLGLGWGTTMYEFVQAASFLNIPNLDIVPLIGGIGIQDIKYHSNHLAFQLAEKYQCKVNYFYAPAIAENQRVYESFSETEFVKLIIEKAKNVDLALIGIGNPIESSTYRRLGYISEAERGEISNHGAVGDILGNFFDQHGNKVNTSVSDRMIGVSLNDLELMNRTFLFGVGKEKIPSFKALLNKGFVDYIAIDKEIADALSKD